MKGKTYNTMLPGVLLTVILLVVDIIHKSTIGAVTIISFLMLFHLAAILLSLEALWSGRRWWQIGIPVIYVLLVVLHRLMLKDCDTGIYYLFAVISALFVIFSMWKGAQHHVRLVWSKRILIYSAVAVVYLICAMTLKNVNTDKNFRTTDISGKFSREASEQGTVVSFSYDTYEYSLDGEALVPMAKECLVYLPYGYSEDNQYNIIYLLQGGGEDIEGWFEDGFALNMLDHLIQDKEIDPCIVVTPSYNFYNDKNYYTDEMAQLDKETGLNRYLVLHVFGYEMRNDLISAVESTYSTYAGGDVSESSLIASREHRAMAGYARGGTSVVTAGLLGNIDLFGWLGNYSGDLLDMDPQELAAAIRTAENNGTPLLYFYNQVGTMDDAFYHTSVGYYNLMQTGCLKEGVNAHLTITYYRGHALDNWYLGLYNSLTQVFFKEK